MARRRRKLPQKEFQASIERFNHELKGVAKLDGKATFIQGALPDEQVAFRYTLQKSNFDEGYCVEVVKASELRAEPPCKHYTMCGGCSLQHMQSDKQIGQKEAILFEQFTHIGKLTPEETIPPLTSNSLGYRHKARLSVRYVEKKQAVLVGFRERNNGRFISDITQCKVLLPQVGEKISLLRQLIEQLDIAKSIAQIEVAAGDTDIALIFRNLSPIDQADSDRLQQFGKQNGFRIYLQPGGPDSIIKLYPDNNVHYLSYSLPDHALSFDFNPTNFTQVNPDINRKMVNLALKLLQLSPTDRVLDLFCGLGNFSLPIAKSCAGVTGVEGCDDMVELAQHNADKNQLKNTEFYQADLTATLSGKWVGCYDKLLIDPPRSGAKEIVEQIELFDCAKIVYVSCNPATLARDADILVNQKGYRLTKAGVMDMFPHTTHVESIAVFDR